MAEWVNHHIQVIGPEAVHNTTHFIAQAMESFDDLDGVRSLIVYILEESERALEFEEYEEIKSGERELDG